MALFEFDEKQKGYIAEIDSMRFYCEELKPEYEILAKELADSYEEKLPEIIEFMLPEIQEIFGDVSEEELMEAIGIPQIDLDREIISYLEQTLDDIHIIDVEFSGIFDEFFEVKIDG